MKGKTRFYVSVMLGLLMIFGVVVAMILNWSNIESIAWLIVALVITVTFMIFIFRDTKRLKKGFPREDEMSIRLKHKAGYYAFLVLLYFNVGFSIVYDTAVSGWGFTNLSTYHVLILEVIVMMVLFIAFWFYFSRKGE